MDNTQLIQVGNVTYTNKYNLPAPMFKALTNPSYVSEGDISVTTLIGPPRVRLFKRHFEHTVDATENIWALFGSAVHFIIERATELDRLNQLVLSRKIYLDLINVITNEMYSGVWNDAWQNPVVQLIYNRYAAFESEIKNFPSRYVSEIRHFVEINGWKLSATPDLYDKEEETLYDYKTTSVWKWIKQKEEGQVDLSDYKSAQFYKGVWDWRLQTNIYAQILRNNGYKVSKIKIIPILKDWSKNEAARNLDFPTSQSEPIEIRLMGSKDIIDYCHWRVQLHQENEAKFNVDPQSTDICARHERWATPESIAVYSKKDASKATKVFKINQPKDKDDAAMFLMEALKASPTAWMEERPGLNTRCDGYCPMNTKCNFYISTLKK